MVTIDFVVTTKYDFFKKSTNVSYCSAKIERLENISKFRKTNSLLNKSMPLLAAVNISEIYFLYLTSKKIQCRLRSH